MHSSSFFSKSIKLLISFSLLLVYSAKLNAQTCDEDQASFKRISDQLQATRAGIKKDEADLTYMNKLINDAIDNRNDDQTKLNAVAPNSYAAKGLNLLINEHNRKIAEYKTREAAIKKELKYLRAEEPILLNSFHLIRDRLDEKCGGVNFDYSKLSGTWQSDWGPVSLSVSKNSVSGNWKQSATRTGQITGGSFDAKTKTLNFTYSQAWNKKTGNVTLVFSETPTEYNLSGSWRHNDGSGGGSWGLKRPK